MKAKARKSMTGAAAVITALAVLAGCGAPKTDSGQTNTYVAPEETNGVVNGTNLEGLPIAAEPITLTVGVSASSSSFQGAWEDLDWIKQLQEVSGITLEFRVYNSDEDKNLMFTSRDYPDISFNVGTDKQIQDAALGGDIYQLDELIQT